MVTKILIIVCVILVYLGMLYIMRKLNEVQRDLSKIKFRLYEIDTKLNTIQGYQISTYNNAIRIAKKLGVYFSINKEVYEEHKKQIQDNNDGKESESNQ